jgi:hypothetical protein
MTVVVTKETGTRTGGSGSAVLRITASPTYPPDAWAQHDFVLSAAVEYRIRGWLRSDPTNTFNPFVWTSRVDGGGADTAIVNPGGTVAWYEFDETFTPAHDSRLRLGGAKSGVPAAHFWFEFDDVTLWATADEPTNPVLYWTAGGGAVLSKDLVAIYEGLQSLEVTAAANDFSQQDINLDERYATVEDAFVMFDGGSGVLRSRVLDPEPPS